MTDTQRVLRKRGGTNLSQLLTRKTATLSDKSQCPKKQPQWLAGGISRNQQNNTMGRNKMIPKTQWLWKMLECRSSKQYAASSRNVHTTPQPHEQAASTTQQAIPAPCITTMCHHMSSSHGERVKDSCERTVFSHRDQRPEMPVRQWAPARAKIRASGCKRQRIAEIAEQPASGTKHHNFFVSRPPSRKAGATCKIYQRAKRVRQVS